VSRLTELMKLSADVDAVEERVAYHMGLPPSEKDLQGRKPWTREEKRQQLSEMRKLLDQLDQKQKIERAKILFQDYKKDNPHTTRTWQDFIGLGWGEANKL
jgi:hypothetical protein